MTISAKVIADSTSAAGVRLTTLQLRYPKFIHGELMTHRVFSRNASSSRAIPVLRLIQDVIDDPVYPLFWGKNQPGMQARDELSNDDREAATFTWDVARRGAITAARQLNTQGAHKQIVNRVLEPFCHINVVVTATEWNNFFALRCHPDAQPEMRALGDSMRLAMATSTPRLLYEGDWHLPYIQAAVGGPLTLDAPEIKVSVARCARVSYLTHDMKSPNVADDISLYDRLALAVPIHASPMEHQATPDSRTMYGPEDTVTMVDEKKWDHPELHGNFRGWQQFRKMVESRQ